MMIIHPELEEVKWSCCLIQFWMGWNRCFVVVGWLMLKDRLSFFAHVVEKAALLCTIYHPENKTRQLCLHVEKEQARLVGSSLSIGKACLTPRHDHGPVQFLRTLRTM